MFEYETIKSELEQVKCPIHGKKAKVTFADGEMKVFSACCEEHKFLLKVLLPEVCQKNITDIIAEMF